MITTGHSNVDYELVVNHAQVVFDTRNVTKPLQPRKNIVVL